jgi:hypothetical protein
VHQFIVLAAAAAVQKAHQTIMGVLGAQAAAEKAVKQVMLVQLQLQG